MLPDKQCRTVIAHKPHEWPYEPAWQCHGVTGKDVAADMMRRKGARQNGWRHLVDVHHINVSERAYGANLKLWDAIDTRLHEAYDRGYAAGMLDAAQAISELTGRE